jgi:hypothetical protein
MVWWALMLTGMSAALLTDLADGDDSLRLEVVTIPVIALAIGAAGVAIWKRSAMRISAQRVEFQGQSILLRGADVDIFVTKQVPFVRVRQHPGAHGGQRPLVVLTPQPFGIDANTLGSCLAQLTRWLDEGRDASPDEILAMLSVRSPEGLAVGSPIEIPLSTPSATARTHRR